MKIEITVGEHGMLSVRHDGPEDATVILTNRSLQVTRGPLPPGEYGPLPYKIWEAEPLATEDWQLGPDTDHAWMVTATEENNHG